MEPKKQKKEYTVALGGLFILLALIGLVTIIVSSVGLTKNLMDNTRQKEEFEQLLRPVVMFDPVPFNNPQEIDSNRLLLYSMWSVLSDVSVNEYSRSEDSSVLLVPASDVGERARSLFGQEVTPHHATFTDNEKSYYYDATLATYEVTTYGYLYVNQPEVISIDRDGDYYRLLISYIPPANAWETIYAGTSAETFSRKTMYYVVKKVDGGWNLAAIMEAPRGGEEDKFTYVPVPYVPKEETEGTEAVSGDAQQGGNEITAGGSQPILPVPEQQGELEETPQAPGTARDASTEGDGTEGVTDPTNPPEDPASPPEDPTPTDGVGDNPVTDIQEDTSVEPPVTEPQA